MYRGGILIPPRFLGDSATDDTWDSDALGALAIPEGTYFLVARTDQPAHVFADTSAAAPTGSDGVIYTATTTHVIACRGASQLHYKNASAGSNVTLSATAFKAS